MTSTNRHAVLALRGRILQAIREFFLSRAFLEVETPVCIPSPALEDYIDAVPAGDRYLRTSPELHLKRLLGEGLDRLFEIGPCFRQGESGRLHRPEFTLLEWYRRDADYDTILDDMKGMVQHVVRRLRGSCTFSYQGHRIDVAGAWEDRTVREVFSVWAGWDPVATFDADRFDVDLVGCVEPRLSMQRPVILRDYPTAAAALARLKADDPSVAERWELYIGGLELANAFSELVDAREQRRRFEQCAAKRRAAGRDVYPLDERFLEALERGLPPCAGVAFGVDRFVMLLADAGTIDEVRAF